MFLPWRAASTAQDRKLAPSTVGPNDSSGRAHILSLVGRRDRTFTEQRGDPRLCVGERLLGALAADERLRLMFGDAATVRLSEVQPHGVLAEVELPA